VGEANSFVLVYLLSNNGRGLPAKGRNDTFSEPRFSISSSMDRSGWNPGAGRHRLILLCIYLNWTIVGHVYLAHLAVGECLK
jgi:hypothetical protein